MAEYQYECSGCRFMFVTESRINIPPCPVCGTVARRKFVFNARLSMPEHFNHSVGGYVSNEREIRDALKEASDRESERLGVDHDYEYLSPADMADSSAHGVTEEGLDATARATHVAD